MKTKDIIKEYNSMEELDLIYQVITAMQEDYENSDSIETVFKQLIPTKCICDDPNCRQWGIEGEIEGHIDGCPCKLCKSKLGKLR